MVFHSKIIWYCDETTITLIVFLKVGQVSESRKMQVQATYNALVYVSASTRFWYILRLPYSDLHRWHMNSIVQYGYHTSSFWSTCPRFLWEIKYSPRTFKNVKMSSFLHFLFYIAVIHCVTRGLIQGGKLSWKGLTGHWTGPTSQHSAKKNLRNDGETACGWLYWNPKSPENNPKTQKINNLLKATKLTQKLKYRLSGSPAFTFYLPGRQFASLSPVSFVIIYDILYLYTVSRPYSTSAR